MRLKKIWNVGENIDTREDCYETSSAILKLF